MIVQFSKITKSEMDSEDEFLLSEPMERNRTNSILSDLEKEEAAATIVPSVLVTASTATGSTSADVTVPTTTTQQQSSRVVATTEERQTQNVRKKRKRTNTENAYGMTFYCSIFFTFVALYL